MLSLNVPVHGTQIVSFLERLWQEQGLTDLFI